MNHIKPRTGITCISIAACVFLSACQLADPQADTPAADTTGTTGQLEFQPDTVENIPQAESIDNARISIDLSQYYITNTGDPTNLYHVDENQVLWGCGSNHYGQLGQGIQDEDFHNEYVKIADNVIHTDYSQSGFSIYLTSDHKLYGFGNAGSGALQQYDSFDWDRYINAEHYVITRPVLMMENVAYARCGRDDIVCLAENGEVWTWGTIAIEGGYQSTDVLFYPEPRKIFDDAAFITGGWFNHAILKSDGTVWTWGYNAAWNCGVDHPEVVDTPVRVAEDACMVWTGSMQLNSDVTDIGQFEGIYPRFMDNTIVQKSDGSYWICGENVGTTEKVVHGAEADYTVVCSYEFLPYNANAIEDGTYCDDMGSELIISHNDGNTYSIDFGVYKVAYFEDAIGEYDPETGILHFSGKEFAADMADLGTVSADITIEDDHLVVTITDWAFDNYLPNGSMLDFYKQPDEE